MFGFTYPAWCMVCMVSGVRFRSGMLAHWVTHSMGLYITQDPRVGPSEASAIHPTHPVCLVACMSEP